MFGCHNDTLLFHKQYIYTFIYIYVVREHAIRL